MRKLLYIELISVLFMMFISSLHASITPFKIPINMSQLEDLKQRLDMTIWPTVLEDIEGDDWSYGIPADVIRNLTSYLRDEYDYATQIKMLNEFDQYIAHVNDMEVHFMHVKSSHSDAKPLMFVHGVYDDT